MDDLGLTCFAALPEWEPPDPRTLRKALGRYAPQASVEIRPRLAEDGQAAVEVMLDRQSFLIVTMPGPLPREECDRAAANALFWPQAGQALAGHRAFVAIAAIGAEDRHGLVRAQAIAMTRLAAAVVHGMGALGLYWRGAEIAAPPGRVIDAVDELDRGKWPADLWVGYMFYGRDTAEAPVIGAQTRGAAAYLGFEIEVPPIPVNPNDRKEPLRILFGATGFLLAMGHRIRDGQRVQILGERVTEWTLHHSETGGPGLAQLTLVN